MEILTNKIAEKKEQAINNLNKHLREIIAWHFDEKTGCSF